MITEKSFVSLSPSLLLREEVFGGLLYNRGEHTSYLLNKAGTLILSLCRDKKTIREVFDLFKEKYDDVDEKILQSDFNSFMGEAIEKKYVKVK